MTAARSSGAAGRTVPGAPDGGRIRRQVHRPDRSPPQPLSPARGPGSARRGHRRRGACQCPALVAGELSAVGGQGRVLEPTVVVEPGCEPAERPGQARSPRRRRRRVRRAREGHGGVRFHDACAAAVPCGRRTVPGQHRCRRSGSERGGCKYTSVPATICLSLERGGEPPQGVGPQEFHEGGT